MKVDVCIRKKVAGEDNSATPVRVSLFLRRNNAVILPPEATFPELMEMLEQFAFLTQALFGTVLAAAHEAAASSYSGKQIGETEWEEVTSQIPEAVQAAFARGNIPPDVVWQLMNSTARIEIQ